MNVSSVKVTRALHKWANASKVYPKTKRFSPAMLYKAAQAAEGAVGAFKALNTDEVIVFERMRLDLVTAESSSWNSVRTDVSMPLLLEWVSRMK